MWCPGAPVAIAESRDLAGGMEWGVGVSGTCCAEAHAWLLSPSHACTPDSRGRYNQTYNIQYTCPGPLLLHLGNGEVLHFRSADTFYDVFLRTAIPFAFHLGHFLGMAEPTKHHFILGHSKFAKNIFLSIFDFW